ncbi:hypothetical protein DW352_02620 [Pseudolabrys taiwanensis]|uniref:Lipoprotein n=1 Tax=Pseudolabrys taiwanensis TaxID=331696 RepID=A0A345ZRG1_9HYPH|nr:hypothetical protein [Pseudolabrys taiwanensis]AXK79508.1 hypothetical protein DW352_02620 [Pseudolabrys taiwanensis]
MRWLALGAAMAALLLNGCARDNLEPSAADLKARWDAQNVMPANYKADLLAYMRTYLNDPTHVRSASVTAPFLKFVGPGDRYIVCVRYNARNTDGKYMGSKDGAAIYVSGKLDRFVDSQRELREMCKDAAFGPFPELEKLTR